MAKDTQLRLDVPLTEEELAALEEVGDATRFPRGSILMGEGETTTFVLLIRKGHVKVVAGTPPRIVAIRGPGDLVGEMAAIRKKPRTASVFALEDVEALNLSATKWLAFLENNFRATLALLYTSQERLAESTQMTVIGQLAAEQKLAKSIVDLWARGLGTTSGDKKILRFSQIDLAELAGISIDSVKKVARGLKARGTISIGRQSITILDLAALESIAQGQPFSQGEVIMSRVSFDASEHSLFSRLNQLDLDREHFVIFGSAPLYVRGMIPAIGDLDIVARGPAWERACRIGMPVFAPPRGIPVIQFWNGKIEVFSEWIPRYWDTDYLIDQSEWLCGFRFVRLECVLTYKFMLQRPKDLVHLDQVRNCFTAERASP